MAGLQLLYPWADGGSCWTLLSQGFKLPEGLRATGDLNTVVAHGQLLLMVVPTPFVASTMSSIRDQLRPEQARHPRP